MTPEEQAIVEIKLKEVAEILYKNTPDEELNTRLVRKFVSKSVTSFDPGLKF